MATITLHGVKWDVNTAGPSPDSNKRTEIFFLGCQKAMDGNACKQCFNHALWDSSIATRTYEPKDIVENIKLHASNRYVTIGGGEPTDQLAGLLELVKLLKEAGFHIMVYSWKSLKDVFSKGEHSSWAPFGEEIDHSAFPFKNKLRKALDYIDIFVDGEYTPAEHAYDDSKGDGLLSSVGSGNQIVWDIPNQIGYAMRDLDALFLKDNDELLYIVKENSSEALTLNLRKGARL